MDSFDYDCLIIGGGAAGLVAAKFGNGIGKKVAIVEKNKLGGECTWTGCVPSKALIKSANVAREIKHAADYGLALNAPTISSSEVMPRLHSIIQEVADTHTPEILNRSGIATIFGSPTFLDPHTVSIDGKRYTAKNFIIATGSHSFVPSIPGLDTVPYLTNETFFNQKILPASIVILGGGAIGVELGCALNNLGVAVTIIEMNDALLAHQDRELTDLLTSYLKEDGVAIKTGCKAMAVSRTDTGILVECQTKNGMPENVSGEQLLVAVGRRPNLAGLELKKAGVDFTKRGITVNKKLQTSTAHIYAAGDVAGPYLFSHMAYYQSALAARNIFLPFSSSVDYTNIVWTIFSNPEFAAAGLTEAEAKEKFGENYAVYRMNYQQLDRAKTEGVSRGLGKVILHKGKIVGAHILGVRAGELIHELQLGKTLSIPFSKFYSVIHAYPTYSELIWHMAKKAYIEKIRNIFFIQLIERIYNFFAGLKGK